MQDSILLVASTEKGIALLQTLVPKERFPIIQLCHNGAETRRAMLQQSYSMALINTPLSDESGLDLALELTQSSITGVLLLVKADLAESVAFRMEERGVLVVAKPVVRQLFEQALRFAMVAHHRMLQLQAEKDRLEKKLAEQRLIDRAKCVLIQYLNMTEEQAHRHIEKQAMDTRQTKAIVARTILSTYEL